MTFSKVKIREFVLSVFNISETDLIRENFIKYSLKYTKLHNFNSNNPADSFSLAANTAQINTDPNI